ncbi:MAG TPA: DinB family protein [Aggregatilineales bacterium]|nr:DinB family protein [Aggregatilineales bacterium]
MVQPPKSDEYAEFYAGYIQRVPPVSGFFTLMTAQPGELKALVHGVTEAQASTPHKSGEWSIKEVLGHINDTERVFAYRALRIARGDQTPLAGFDQDAYVRHTDFNQRTVNDLINEFAGQRQANVWCFKPLTEAEIDRRGTASNHPVSVRALLYMLVGHVLHHMESLRADYELGG